MGTATIAETAMFIMDLSWAVNTYAYHDLIAPEAITPGVVDQGTVCLYVLLDLNPRCAVLSEAALNNRSGFVVVAAGES
jgi:hypothetical protein